MKSISLMTDRGFDSTIPLLFQHRRKYSGTLISNSQLMGQLLAMKLPAGSGFAPIAEIAQQGILSTMETLVGLTISNHIKMK
jgi:hypothetical protein